MCGAGDKRNGYFLAELCALKLSQHGRLKALHHALVETLHSSYAYVRARTPAPTTGVSYTGLLTAGLDLSSGGAAVKLSVALAAGIG